MSPFPSPQNRRSAACPFNWPFGQCIWANTLHTRNSIYGQRAAASHSGTFSHVQISVRQDLRPDGCHASRSEPRLQRTSPSRDAKGHDLRSNGAVIDSFEADHEMRRLPQPANPNDAFAGLVLSVLVALVVAGRLVLEGVLVAHVLQVLMFIGIIVASCLTMKDTAPTRPAPDSQYRPPDAANIWRTYSKAWQGFAHPQPENTNTNRRTPPMRAACQVKSPTVFPTIFTDPRRSGIRSANGGDFP